MAQETEIKIAIGEAGERLAEVCHRLEGGGFTIHKPRVFERNLVFDNAAGELKQSHRLLRLREAGGQATLTYKGAAETGGKHKSREERETEVSGAEEMRGILESLGYRVGFIYEKFRTEYMAGEGPGQVTVDETPAGDFLELEGEAGWIDATARLLGFTERDYLTVSYSRVYRDWCRSRGVEPGDMQFPEAYKPAI